MAGACLLFDVRPHIAEGLARRLSARDVACLVLDSSGREGSGAGLSYAISTDGGLADLEIGGRPIDPATILGTYAEPADRPEWRRDPRLPLTPHDFARDERRAALAAVRALLPGCLNPPRDGALSGGFLPPAEQQARIRRDAPDLADMADRDATLAERPAGSGSDADRAAGGAICSCLFVGNHQHHFVWSDRGPTPVNPGTAAFARVGAAVARIAGLFGIDAGEVSYRFDGAFRFRALVPMLGHGDAYPFDAWPAPLDDLAGRLCGDR